MLPDFPATKAELKRAVTERLRRGVYSNAVLLSRIRKFMGHEGDSFTIHRLDGTVEKNKYRETAVELTINKTDITTLTPQALGEKIDKIASEMAEKTSKVMIEKLHQVSTEAGQVHDAKGRPLSPDLILEMLEKIDIDFDKKGQPSGLNFLVSPEMGERIRQKGVEWEADPEFQRRHAELMERKREAWRDRESRRKLVN